ncbi:hypothetical protein BUALT_Bualt02G0131100 [Buddleja alternifolia]|uniref:Arf-GAP domain-containing protein n=1 Tax=Buddleja alternifolia TaxID=168488 RepID=A0AAV6Y415_9LAMI|nr:hypothetical protein BUALT_Bualt02G0131100 [Buddleja alternifolia]
MAINEKASVSKELEAKHAKILEGLLKLPENRECADCRSKSLGVHISKVRSTTLDTWLPEQIDFMEMMGNEKANNYWEAELPQDFDRNPIEKFIHEKYVEKRWTSTTCMEPTQMVRRKSHDKLAGASAAGIPKKARKYSLEDGIFIKDIPQVAPISHIRAGSLDLMGNAIPAPSQEGISVENNTSVKNVEATKDLFSLLYVSEENQNRTVVPPSRWATFECAQLTPTYWTLIVETKIILGCVTYTMASFSYW